MIVKAGFRRRALVVALTTIYGVGSQLAHANPTGAQVVNGQANLQTQGGKLTVTNTPGAIINWQSFNIGAGETTYFQQQNAASAVLNRVQTISPALKSQIDGTLGSNGRVFLINPNGMVFGAGSVIDTQGFVASTLSMKDDDFKSGKLKFSNAGGAGSIQAKGAITSNSGDVYLIAPNIGVDGNAVITSSGGNIVLAAGEMVEITGRNLNDITFQVQSTANQAINLGTLSGGAVGVFAGTLTHSGVIRAQTLANEGGRLVLKAQGNVSLATGSKTQADGQTLGGSVAIASQAGTVTLDTSALVSAQALAAATPGQATPRGGDVTIHAAAGNVAIEGDAQVAVSGGRGGSIDVQAVKLAQNGALRADGSSTFGGTITVSADSRLIQSAGATVSAQGVLKGGDIRLSVDTDPNGSGHLFTSATMDASASSGVGGTVTITGRDLTFAAAHLAANGDAGGGSLRVGGGRAGQDGSVANSQNIVASAASIFEASARVDGDGGTVITWANGSNRFAGSLAARGGAAGGNGGFIEVSGKEETQFGGFANASAPMGKPGTFLLDPKYILIQAPAVVPGGSVELLDPNPGNGDLFGQNLLVLNGNILVFNSTDDFSGTNSGAIYLYDGTTGALLSNLRGSAANDRVGSSNSIFRTLGSGSYLINSPFWNNSAGAITVFNTTTGVSGTVSSANSLVGSSAGDQIGSGGTQNLTGGKFAIFSPNWNSAAGAITWADGTAGITGVVSAANSLVGSTANDRVGSSGIQNLGTVLAIRSPNWNNGSASLAGAITWADLQNGIVGTVGPSNSLVGSFSNDRVGLSGLNFLTSVSGVSKYYAATAGWNSNAGALTFINSAAPTVGAISSANSLVGSTAGDQIGSNGLTSLGNGKSAVFSPNWDNGTATNAGAITWFDQANGTFGVVGAANSLVGSNTNDRVGDNGIDFLTTVSGVNKYYVYTDAWNNSAGAITFIDSAAPAVGAVSAANSLVGSTAGDAVGSGGVQNIGSGKALVFSPNWDNGGAVDAGAVTWYDMAAGTVGAVSTSNSLVGSSSDDQVGSGFLQFIGSKIAIRSPNWNNSNASATSAGAVTFVDPASGIFGAVSDTNSLVGSHTNDFVGSDSIQQFSNGKYYLATVDWNGSAGAVTWIDSTLPPVGAISSTNSLVGTAANDQVGSGGIVDLFNGKSMVFSPNWANSGVTAAGAVTWFDQAAGTTGAVGAGNSIVGSRINDQVGGFADYQTLGNKVAIFSPNWDTPSTISNVGAITWADAATGAFAVGGGFGAVSASNSLTGSFTNDRVGNSGLNYLDTISGVDKYYVATTNWNSNAGAVTFVDTAAPVVGAISSSNSLVGSVATDLVGSGGVQDLSNGQSLVFSPQWNSSRGAVTWFSHATATTGTISTSNSLIGSTSGDFVGSGGFDYVGNSIAIFSPNWNNGGSTAGAGAITWATNPATPIHDFVSASNSLVGSHANDLVGNNSFLSLDATHIAIRSPNWNSAAGAITWINTAAPTVGAVDSVNSLVGAVANDQIGSAGFSNLGNGKSVVLSPNWDGNKGAVTWFDNASGTFGIVGAGNSLVGSTGGTVTTGDRVGASSYQFIGNLLAFRTPNWNNIAASATLAGAITFVDPSTGISGVLNETNSLVGTHSNDRVGLSGIQSLSSGKYYSLTSGWNSNAGALTFIDGAAAPLVGAVSASNSLVGANANDQIGSGGFLNLGSNRYLLTSTHWNGDRGAVTWYDSAAGTFGTVGAANSLVGSTAGDLVGSDGRLFIGSLIGIRSQNWDNGAAVNAGAITWANPLTGITGAVSASNSLVGGNSNDRVGSSGSVDFMTATTSALRTTSWNSNAGAVTWLNNAAPLVGQISSSNSLVGSSANDFVGSSGFTTSPAGYKLLTSSSWNGTRGAVTWIDPNAPLTGVVSAANSLVGANAGDFVGSGGISFGLANGDYIVRSPSFGGASVGALTVGSKTGGISGTVSGANSLIGFGTSFQLVNSNTRLLVARGTASSGGFSQNGRICLYAGGAGCTINIPLSLPQSYATNAGSSITITPDQITAITNGGTNLVLQANSDITLAALSDIITKSGGNGGDITLQAGRSVLINSKIVSDNGNITIIANDTTSNGVVAAERDAGVASITMADGTLLDAGTGNVDVQLRDGAGHAGAFTAADTSNTHNINLRSITANNLSVFARYGGIKFGDSRASSPTSVDIAGDISLSAKTEIVIAGAGGRAFANVAFGGTIVNLPVTVNDAQATFSLTGGGGSARLVNTTKTFPIDFVKLNCTQLTCLQPSSFELVSPNGSFVDPILGQILPPALPFPPKIKDPKGNEDDIALEGETCS